jgi:hypothetical protein
MESESVFGVEPEQLGELLSVGEDDLNDSAAQSEPSPSDRQPADKSESTSGADVFTEQPGSWIGPYKLLKVLGEGGMGIAYLAEQKQPMGARLPSRSSSPVWIPGVSSAVSRPSARLWPCWIIQISLMFTTQERPNWADRIL